jgi:hypothetical protein
VLLYALHRGHEITTASICEADASFSAIMNPQLPQSRFTSPPSVIKGASLGGSNWITVWVWGSGFSTTNNTTLVTTKRLLMQIKTDDEIVQKYFSEGRDLPPGEYFVTKTIVVGHPPDLAQSSSAAMSRGVQTWLSIPAAIAGVVLRPSLAWVSVVWGRAKL